MDFTVHFLFFYCSFSYCAMPVLKANIRIFTFVESAVTQPILWLVLRGCLNQKRQEESGQKRQAGLRNIGRRKTGSPQAWGFSWGEVKPSGCWPLPCDLGMHLPSGLRVRILSFPEAGQMACAPGLEQEVKVGMSLFCRFPGPILSRWATPRAGQPWCQDALGIPGA